MKNRAASLVTALFLSLFVVLAVFGQGTDEGIESRQIAELIERPGIWTGDGYKAHLPLVLSAESACGAAPKLISPANGSQLDNIIPLKVWDNGNDQAATLVRLEMDKNPSFYNPWGLWSSAPTTGVRDHRFASNLEPATKYYWRTWLECDGQKSPYSEIWSFTTGSGGAILPGPNLISPADGSTLTTLPQTFTWSAVGGAVEYIVSWRPAGLVGYRIVGRTDQTNYDIGWLDASKEYEWWITARNVYAFGNESVMWRFTSPNTVSARFTAPDDAGIDVEIRPDGERLIRSSGES